MLIARITAALVLQAGYISAQTLSIDQAVELALKTHPLLASGRARAESAAGLREQAGLRPNPKFVFQAENWRAHGTPSFDPGYDPDTFAYLTQTFELGGKRERRVDLADAGVRRAELEREVLARQVAARVRQAYWNAAGAAAVHKLLEESAGNFGQIVEYHVIRVREGAVAEADLLKVQLEQERLAIAVNSALLDAERARIQLFREMGQTEFPEVSLAEVTPDAPQITADSAAAISNRLELKLVRAILEQSQANARLQRAVARPDLEALFGFKRTAGFNTVLGGMQVAIPWRNRNQGAIASAEAESRAAEADIAAAEAMVRAEVKAAETEVRMRREQLNRLFGRTAGSGLRGKAAESSRIAMAAYREGGTDLLRLLDSERVRIELQVLYVRTVAEYRQSVAALQAAMGVNP